MEQICCANFRNNNNTFHLLLLLVDSNTSLRKKCSVFTIFVSVRLKIKFHFCFHHLRISWIENKINIIILLGDKFVSCSIPICGLLSTLLLKLDTEDFCFLSLVNYNIKLWHGGIQQKTLKNAYYILVFNWQAKTQCHHNLEWATGNWVGVVQIQTRGQPQTE